MLVFPGTATRFLDPLVSLSPANVVGFRPPAVHDLSAVDRHNVGLSPKRRTHRYLHGADGGETDELTAAAETPPPPATQAVANEETVPIGIASGSAGAGGCGALA